MIHLGEMVRFKTRDHDRTGYVRAFGFNGYFLITFTQYHKYTIGEDAFWLPRDQIEPYQPAK